MIQEIYIIDDDESSIIIFRELFKNDKEYNKKNVEYPFPGNAFKVYYGFQCSRLTFNIFVF